ncbi:MAG: hypothetical protein WCF03_16440 [Nitrososphaeraceae archaeon]
MSLRLDRTIIRLKGVIYNYDGRINDKVQPNGQFKAVKVAGDDWS